MYVLKVRVYWIKACLRNFVILYTANTPTAGVYVASAIVFIPCAFNPFWIELPCISDNVAVYLSLTCDPPTGRWTWIYETNTYSIAAIVNYMINRLRPEQNNIFICISLSQNYCISFRIPLKVVPTCHAKMIKIISGKWLGAIGQQAITGKNVPQHLTIWRYMASLAHSASIIFKKYHRISWNTLFPNYLICFPWRDC